MEETETSLDKLIESLADSVQYSYKEIEPEEEEEKDYMFEEVVITPTRNGYVVSENTDGDTIDFDNIHVFNSIEDAFQFIKANLKPTGEQENFLENIG